MGAPGSATNPKNQRTQAPPENLTKTKSRAEHEKNWRAKVGPPAKSAKAKNQVRFREPEATQEPDTDSESEPESENEKGPVSIDVFPPDTVFPSDLSISTSTRPISPSSVSPSMSVNNNPIPRRSEPRELPFRSVPEVSFVPAAQPEKLAERVAQSRSAMPRYEKRGSSYKNKAPVEREGQAAHIAEKMMKQIVALETEELLGVSPALQKEVLKLLAKRRIPQVMQTLQEDEGSSTEEEDVPPPVPKKDKVAPKRENPTPIGEEESLYVAREPDAIMMDELPKAVLIIDSTWEEGGRPTGAVVMSDPYLQYLETLAPGESPKQVIIAKPSESLRVVYPVINGKKELEAVSDSGSQIVSMSEAVAIDLGIPWDPDITIHMQSANKQLEKTLGLARDVAFRFNDLTVYLQVHVLKNPAYKVLLGRPFDVLTESEVKNKKDGSQSITIRCPNTGQRLVVPTFTRGLPPVITKHLDGEDFR